MNIILQITILTKYQKDGKGYQICFFSSEMKFLLINYKDNKQGI